MQGQKEYSPHLKKTSAGKDAPPKARPEYRVLVNGGISGLAYIVAAYLLGSCRLWLGTYPLGFGLLCAAEGRVSFILIGLIASAGAGRYPAVYIGAYIIALVLRVITRIFIDTSDSGETPSAPAAWIRWMRKRLFHESVSLRMTAASLCAFITGLYAIIAGGYRYYDLFGAVFSILLAPALVWLLAGWFAGDATDKDCAAGASGAGASGAKQGVCGGRKWRHARYLAGIGVLISSLCFAAREVVLLGISVAAFGAFFVTLLIGRRYGVLAGAAAGLLCGVAFDPVYAPLFILAAIADGLLCGVSPVLAAAAAFASGMTWGLYIDGIDALTRLMPGLLLSSAVFCGAEGSGLLARIRAYPEAGVAARAEKLAAEAEYANNRILSDEQRLLAVSESFASLSEIFYNLSDRLRRPGIIDLRRVCDNVFDRVCPGCAKRDICWGLEYGSSLDMIARLCSGLHENGRADADCIPEHIKKRCPKLPDIIRDVNAGCASLTEAVLKSEKVGIFALDYDAMSRILSEAVQAQREEFSRAADAEERVGEALARLGLVPEVIYVYGERRKFICARGIDAASARTDAAAVRRALEEVCSCRLDEPLFEYYGGQSRGRLSITLTGKRTFAAARACMSAASPATADGVCGDSICMFENGRDYFYALISDGMGTGSGAAFSSGVCSLFLEKMLMAGNRTATALRMLNGVLRSKGGAREMECSATVDLLEVDLITGDASLIKSGAAPTFVRRGDDIFRLHSKTVPIGILAAIDAQQTKLEVRVGDVIVMISDGICDAAGGGEGEEDCGWLLDLLSYEWEDDLDRMAKKIIGRAQSAGGVDDLSVAVVRIAAY